MNKSNKEAGIQNKAGIQQGRHTARQAYNKAGIQQGRHTARQAYNKANIQNKAGNM